MTRPTRDRLAGCLVGQCLGDALGFPVEGRPPELCAGYVASALADPEHHFAAGEFGQYTDDSQLARELMQSFAAVGRFDPADYARRVAALFTESRIVGRGRATEAAAERLAAGVPWDRAGTPAPQAGNGSAMRAAPVGLLHDNEAARLRAAEQQAIITHRDPRSTAGAVAIAEAAWLAATLDGAIDVPRFCAHLAERVARHDPVLDGALRELPRWLAVAPEELAGTIASVGREPGYTDRWRGISPFVTPSVLWSLYSFLRAPDDYWAVARCAIAVGGDVDTTAAMAGALAGARLGCGKLPQLAKRVHDQNTWGYHALVALAHTCHDVKEPS